MKKRLLISVIAAALWIATNVALAHHSNNGNHRGWSNPNHPHAYASPKAHGHP